jgi:hypothetical protein
MFPAQVWPAWYVTVPGQVANPGQVLKFWHVFAAQVPAGAHVGAPWQVPKARHDGLGAHDATPAHVAFPCIVTGTQRIAQLAPSIVG